MPPTISIATPVSIPKAFITISMMKSTQDNHSIFFVVVSFSRLISTFSMLFISFLAGLLDIIDLLKEQLYLVLIVGFFFAELYPTSATSNL